MRYSVLLIAALVGVLLAGCGGSKVAVPPTSVSATATPWAPTRIAELVGKRVILIPSGGIASVFLSATKMDFDHFQQASMKRDDYGMQSLVQTGKMFSVPTGTSALVLDSDFSYDILLAQVRLLSGTRTGTLGWAVADSIQVGP